MCRAPTSSALLKPNPHLDTIVRSFSNCRTSVLTSLRTLVGVTRATACRSILPYHPPDRRMRLCRPSSCRHAPARPTNERRRPPQRPPPRDLRACRPHAYVAPPPPCARPSNASASSPTTRTRRMRRSTGCARDTNLSRIIRVPCLLRRAAGCRTRWLPSYLLTPLSERHALFVYHVCRTSARVTSGPLGPLTSPTSLQVHPAGDEPPVAAWPVAAAVPAHLSG